MTPEERMEITGVISALLGFCEGTITVHYMLKNETERAIPVIEKTGEIQRARKLLEKLCREAK